MKQKRKVKSLIPQKKNWSESFLVMILLALSIALCLWSASLMTASVLWATPSNISRPFTNITYTWLDDNQEVLYDMKFVDPNNLYRVVSDIYISGASLYISPSPVIVHPLNSLGQVDRTVNVVKSGVYSHILWWRNNDVRSANITLVAWEWNIVYEGSDNDSILWWKNHHQIYGGSAWSAPSVVAWWEDHFLGSSSDGVVFLWWNGNSVHSASTNWVLLWWKDNTISYVNNVIVWWSNIYDEMSANNIFAYSNFSSNFYPESSNAFYLNMLKWVGIGMDSDDKWLYVSGVVSVWEIDITSIGCNNSNYWVIGMFNGCIVWCTASWSSNAKRNMLDRSEHCLDDVCDDYYSFCIPWSDPVPSHPNYPAFCITWDLDLNLDRVELCYPDLLNYENIVFQADLVDDCDSDNKCMYKCKEGYSREWTWCFSDCTMDWLDADDETFKHNVAFTWYSSWSLSCGILRDDWSDSECGNFWTGLVCYDWTIYLADNGWNYIPGSSVQAQSYNYRSCGLSGFDCDSTYNLDWLAVKFDFPENFNTVALPSFNIWDILTWIAWWVYELCVDYNVYGGQCRRSWYEFVKLGCTTWYTYIESDGSCKKDCINWLAHWETGFYYNSTWAVCDHICNGQTLKCNNWHLSYRWKKAEGVYVDVSIPDGENWYPYTWCNLLDKVCDASYNVTEDIYNTRSWTTIYSSGCTNYSGNNLNNTCDATSTFYKLVACRENYHTGSVDDKYCIPNEMTCKPPVPYETGPEWEWVLKWTGVYLYWSAPDPDYWDYVLDNTNLGTCKWSCKDWYVRDWYTCVKPDQERLPCNSPEDYDELELKGATIWSSWYYSNDAPSNTTWNYVDNPEPCSSGFVPGTCQYTCPCGMVWDNVQWCREAAGYCSSTDLWKCDGGVSSINTGYCEDDLCVWQCEGATQWEYAQKWGIMWWGEDRCWLCEDGTEPDTSNLDNGDCTHIPDDPIVDECEQIYTCEEWYVLNSDNMCEPIDSDMRVCMIPYKNYFDSRSNGTKCQFNSCFWQEINYGMDWTNECHIPDDLIKIGNSIGCGSDVWWDDEWIVSCADTYILVDHFGISPTISDDCYVTKYRAGDNSDVWYYLVCPNGSSDLRDPIIQDTCIELCRNVQYMNRYKNSNTASPAGKNYLRDISFSVSGNMASSLSFNQFLYMIKNGKLINQRNVNTLNWTFNGRLNIFGWNNHVFGFPTYWGWFTKNPPWFEGGDDYVSLFLDDPYDLTWSGWITTGIHIDFKDTCSYEYDDFKYDTFNQENYIISKNTYKCSWELPRGARLNDNSLVPTNNQQYNCNIFGTNPCDYHCQDWYICNEDWNWCEESVDLCSKSDVLMCKNGDYWNCWGPINNNGDCYWENINYLSNNFVSWKCFGGDYWEITSECYLKTLFDEGFCPYWYQSEDVFNIEDCGIIWGWTGSVYNSLDSYGNTHVCYGCEAKECPTWYSATDENCNWIINWYSWNSPCRKCEQPPKSFSFKFEKDDMYEDCRDAALWDETEMEICRGKRCQRQGKEFYENNINIGIFQNLGYNCYHYSSIDNTCTCIR